MQLETDLEIVDDPTDAIIQAAVTDLVRVGDSFIILSSDAQTYLQAAGTVNENFRIEYRDGSAGEHYCGDRLVTATELAAMLKSYLAGDDRWRSEISWHRFVVDPDLRPTA